MSNLCLTNQDLVTAVADYMGWDSPASDQRAFALARVNDGVRQFLRGQFIDDDGHTRSHAWSFMRPEASLVIWPTAVGLIQSVGGAGNTVITAAAAIFHPSMIGATLTAGASGNAYTIAGYSSSTQVAVDADASADDGDAFAIEATGLYALPADFGGLIEPFVYVADEYPTPRIQDRPPSVIDARHRDCASLGAPECYCLQPVAADNASPQRWYVKLAPITDQVRTLRYRYRVQIDALADSAEAYPPGGVDFCDAVKACAIMAAEAHTSRTEGQWAAVANRAIRDGALLDGTVYDTIAQDQLEE